LYVALRSAAPSLFIDETKFDELTEVADNDVTALMAELSEHILKPKDIPSAWVLVCLGNLCVQHHNIHIYLFLMYMSQTIGLDQLVEYKHQRHVSSVQVSSVFWKCILFR
jgi:hypothetical protein